MNAKITITVPLDKLHIKIADLLDELASNIESVSIDLTGVSKETRQKIDILKQLHDIDSIRKKMALLDANLEDCYNVLVGLVNYQANDRLQDKNNNDEQSNTN